MVMEFTGLTRPIDSMGRFVIPKRIRNQMQAEELEMHTEKECIVLDIPNCSAEKRQFRYVKRLDELGRLQIPVEIRNSLYLDYDDRLQIYTDDTNKDALRLILKKEYQRCIFCDTVYIGMITHNNKPVCRNCMNALMGKFQAEGQLP